MLLMRYGLCILDRKQLDSEVMNNGLHSEVINEELDSEVMNDELYSEVINEERRQ
jgi:hypothetical protein